MSQQLHRSLDFHAQHVLLGTQPEHSSHPAVELFDTAPNHRSQIRTTQGRLQVLTNMVHERLQALYRHALICRSLQIPANADESRWGGPLTAGGLHNQLGRQIPTEPPIRTTDQFKLIAQRLPDVEHTTVLCFVEFATLGIEELTGPATNHLPLRSAGGATHEGGVHFDVGKVRIFDAEHDVNQRLVERDQLLLTSENPLGVSARALGLNHR